MLPDDLVQTILTSIAEGIALLARSAWEQNPAGVIIVACLVVINKLIPTKRHHRY